MDSNSHVVSGTFENRSDAERAINELRQFGIDENAISIISHNDHSGSTSSSNTVDDDSDNTGSGLAKGVGVGAGVGALFGLAALAIPGVGPFIAAGALANVLGGTAGAVAAGAIVGGTAGGISGAMMNYGVSEEDAKYYEERVNKGDVFVSVDTRETSIPRDRIWDVFQRYNATTASRQMAN
jgi:hypothetical protein